MNFLVGLDTTDIHVSLQLFLLQFPAILLMSLLGLTLLTHMYLFIIQSHCFWCLNKLLVCKPAGFLVQVQRESEVYERTLQKLNQQLQASLASMAGEKNALLLSLSALQDQFEGMANAVYTAEETVVGKALHVLA